MVAGYYFQRPLFFLEYQCPQIGFISLCSMFQGGGLTQSPTRLRRDGLFTCLLSKVNFARIQLKKPSTLRVGGFVPEIGFISLCSMFQVWWSYPKPFPRLRRGRSFSLVRF